MDADPDNQIPFLSIGFRPFFLVAGVYSAVAMLAWMAWLGLHGAGAAILKPTIAVPAHLWHGHEMLFGFAGAVISGFMLTAGPGWTGARRVAGSPLVVLVSVWLAGRIVMWFSSFLPALVVAAVDMAFLPLLCAMVAAALIRQPQPRNVIFLALLVILTLANAGVHAEWTGLREDTASRWLAVAVIDIVLMITILGGRIVPSFTRNAMIRRGDTAPHPRQAKALEISSIAGVAGVLACVVLALPAAVTGAATLFAALANLARQLQWRPTATIWEPILWSLHLAYLWIPVGLASLAASLLLDAMSQSAALHVLSVGCIGGMTLAMMTRAPLGHTGRPLVVRRSIALSYLMVAAAVVLRGFALDLLPAHYFQVVLLAGALWVGGFAIFVAIYLPILTGPSLKGQTSE